MIWILIIVALLLLSIPFAWLSLELTLVDLPRRFFDWLSGLRERRERHRMFKARQAQVKAVFDAINRREL